jgi:uncharacterized small protein (DUF1192 family)
VLRLLGWLAIGLVLGVLIVAWLTPALDRLPAPEPVASQPAPGAAGSSEYAGLTDRRGHVAVSEVDSVRNDVEILARIAALEEEVGALSKALEAERNRRSAVFLPAVPQASRAAYALNHWNGPPGEVALNDEAFVPGPSTLAGVAAEPGRMLVFEVTGSIVGAVRGTDIYTDDSSLAAAAVHSGALRADETGTIIVNVLPGQQTYAGSSRHGVFSSDSSAWTRSYTLERLN